MRKTTDSTQEHADSVAEHADVAAPVNPESQYLRDLGQWAKDLYDWLSPATANDAPLPVPPFLPDAASDVQPSSQ
jgi:hypothetical protein